jgi:polysaccharide export outer membrane protein
MKCQFTTGFGWAVCGAALALATLSLTGCHTGADPSAMAMAQAQAAASETAPVKINPGDVVQLTFPGAPAMNISERVRVDGHLFLPLVGEVEAAGKTPKELQADLAEKYSKDLRVTEVVVNLSSSTASIFVTGAVLHPGRIAMERPLTVLDAIMEAGGFDPRRANVKKVALIRRKEGQYSKRILNLKPILRGENIPPVSLEPFDIVFVPEKIF